MADDLALAFQPVGDLAMVTAAAEQAARHWNLACPTLIRLGMNGVFASDQIVLRVSRRTASVANSLRLSERLDVAGVRVARAARTDVFVTTDGLEVRAWERIEHDVTIPVDWERVGAMVAKVHALDASSVGHPLPFCGDFPWWDFDTMMHEATNLDAATMAALKDARRNNAWWLLAARTRPLVLCHGDVHPGNVLVDANGPVLVDWDLVCLGPAAWDHAPLMTWTRRWGGAPGIYEAFNSGYGVPVDDDFALAIAQMRLLSATLMRLQRARLDPRQHDEASLRLRYWRGEPDAPMWHPQ